MAKQSGGPTTSFHQETTTVSQAGNMTTAANQALASSMTAIPVTSGISAPAPTSIGQ